MKVAFSIVLLTLSGLALAEADPSLWARDTTHQLTKRCPPFDPAGVKNIGNGAAGQFIGGQCLSNADCASACCANPCGICSGPGASFQAGKTGCGFASGSGSGNKGTNVVPATGGNSKGVNQPSSCTSSG